MQGKLGARRHGSVQQCTPAAETKRNETDTTRSLWRARHRTEAIAKVARHETRRAKHGRRDAADGRAAAVHFEHRFGQLRERLDLMHDEVGLGAL